MLAIPSKRCDKRQLQFLTRPEVESDPGLSGSQHMAVLPELGAGGSAGALLVVASAAYFFLFASAESDLLEEFNARQSLSI